MSEWIATHVSGADQASAPSPDTRSWSRRAFDVPVRAGRTFRDWMWPPVCAACRTAIGTPHGLCASCWGAIGFIERPFCERFGTPFALDIGGSLLSPQAIADPPVFRRARAVARYDEIARGLVQRLKYGDQLDLAETLAGLMARAGRELLAEADLIVPVPLHRMRLWSRRFNQAALLARIIARQSGVPVDLHLLTRRKHNRSQVGLTRAERMRNVSGIFAVSETAKLRAAGKRILLIDDVLTTGATLNAASRILLRAGAEQVDVLTFARVVVGE